MFSKFLFQVANEEPTNGLKILRKKNTVVDLSIELSNLTKSSVIQRLKLILQKLESGQLEDISKDTLSKNIQYAVDFIQGEATTDGR